MVNDTLSLNTSFADSFLSADDYSSIQSKVENAKAMLKHEVDTLNEKRKNAKSLNNPNGFDLKKETPVGWFTLPDGVPHILVDEIDACAKRVQKLCGKDGMLIVIGIGGSYLGARAAIEFCKSENYNINAKDTPSVYFAGNSLSPSALNDIYEMAKEREICVNVISKSGNTTEPSLVFRIFRQLVEEKYGDKAPEHIIITTDWDEHCSTLRKFINISGGKYDNFIVDEEIGGRYSVLTAAGLLPIAVAGIDIREMMAGAKEAKDLYSEPDMSKNDCYKYAALRNILYSQGKKTEIFAAYEPSLALFEEWLKQLFGESEGKDGKGIYPSSVIYTRDLHSLGQYVQQGERTLFETVLNMQSTSTDITVAKDADNLDGMNFLAGKKVSEINQMAYKATVLAHTDGGVPNIILNIKDNSAKTFGHMAYFFELACAISGYILGVNPFDQPGVEAYKKFMYALLGKPGYEELKAKLEARLTAFDD